MRFRALVFAVAMGLASHLAAPAMAERWFAVAPTAGGLYELDGDTLTIKDEVVESWMRQTLTRPTRDPGAGKPYTTELIRRSDDCKRRRFSYGAYVRRSASGDTVATGSVGTTGWQDIAPGSVAEQIWDTVCLAVNPPAEEPFLPSIVEGQWRTLGTSAGAERQFVLSVLADRVIRLEDGYVLAILRSDFVKPQWVSGVSLGHTVSATLLDCKAGKSATIGTDAYITPALRVKSVRTDEDKLDFAPGAPGSFLAVTMKDVCALAVAAKNGGDDAARTGEVFTGTAWGVNKGYLVTASHVIDKARRIVVYSGGEPIGEAKVVVDDPANDLAVLKFATSGRARLKVFNIAPRGATLGKNVFTLGFPRPGVLGQGIKMTAGQVSSTSGARDDARFLQISVPLQQGNSGGPVLAWDGTVVGVVSAKLTQFEPDQAAGEPLPEMVNYAVKASYIRPMLDDLPDLGGYELVKPAADQDQMVAAARAAVFMLVVTQ